MGFKLPWKPTKEEDFDASNPSRFVKHPFKAVPQSLYGAKRSVLLWKVFHRSTERWDKTGPGLAQVMGTGPVAGGPLSTLCLYFLPLRYANMLIANYKKGLAKSDPDALPRFEALERKHHTGVGFRAVIRLLCTQGSVVGLALTRTKPLKVAYQTQLQILELFRSWEVEYNGMAQKRGFFGKALGSPPRIFSKRNRVDNDVDLEEAVESTKTRKAGKSSGMKAPPAAKVKGKGKSRKRG